MPISSYKIWATGGPVGRGATGAIHVGMAGIAKKATATEPYIVSNELICSQLAQAILLPCPPGAIMEHGGESYFFSLNFNLAGAALPPIKPSEVCLALADVAWGIILFDILIMNADRHRENISYDKPSGRAAIFDHSHALLGVRGDIDARLRSGDASLQIGSHCLAQVIESESGREKWEARIAEIPNFFIDDVCQSATAVGLPAASADACATFLKRRRDDLSSLVDGCRNNFPKLNPSVQP